MIPASQYHNIYILLVSVMTISLYQRYNIRKGHLQYSDSKSANTVILVIFFLFFIGLRPISGRYFVDMANYVESYHAFYEGVPFSFEWYFGNVLFDNFFALSGSLCLGTKFIFTVVAAVYFGTSYLGIKKMFPHDTLAVYLVFLAAFSTFSYATNGIKAGAAASFFIFGIAYREKLSVSIPLILLSIGIHHAMILPVGAFFLSLVIKNPKVYFVAWCLCFVFAAAHITLFQTILGYLTSDTLDDGHGAGYLMDTTSDWGGKSGFRLDFVLYSAMPVLVGYWAVFKKKMQLSKMYKCLLNVYLCTNGIWILCMYAAFTNRIAYLSWFLYPIVLVYPFLNENWGNSRYKTFSNVMLAHLFFTLSI